MAKRESESEKQQHAEDFKKRVEGSTEFRSVSTEMKKASDAKREDLRQNYESNGEVQRWRGQMNPTERTREAIDRSTQSIMKVEEFRTGRPITEEAARRKAEDFAKRSDRDRK